MTYPEYTHQPFVKVSGNHQVWKGWKSVAGQLLKDISSTDNIKVIVIEYYPGVLEEEVTVQLEKQLHPSLLIQTRDLFLPEEKIREMVFPDVTDDRIFGHISALEIDAFFDPFKLKEARQKIQNHQKGIVLLTGPGAAWIWDNPGLLVYADMARWEIQLRMRKHEVDNLGVKNRHTNDWMLLYKQGFFVDWRVCDRWKKKILLKCHYLLDTNQRDQPKMITCQALSEGLKTCMSRPFSLVPFFDPGPWGGQWMKKKLNLPPDEKNYAWCFNCVPEENSLLLKFDNEIIEIPAIDLVFFYPEKLLGPLVYKRFGDEFPIRFDFLDTIDGGNLSLQVHPMTAYIREKFGISYTQDESYYMMDAKPGASVYLGLKENILPEEMIASLGKAQRGEISFPADQYVASWPAKKHDHFLIPAGTVHCSGKDCMVLEVSSTPYIFTFKLWDWDRLGLDGKPRPINIEHGKQNIQWERTVPWTLENLVNRIEQVASGNGWVEEKTGLHALEFIETRRHWFTEKVFHNTCNNLHVICLIEGNEVVVESPEKFFDPFIVHYAETFIVPAMVGSFSITPHGSGAGMKCATLKAYVRSNC